MDLSDLRFLVAEDRDFQRRHLVSMLGELGATKVLETADGRGALDYFSDLTLNLDIVICDLDMPGMDGMELIRHIGKSGAPASIILTSALDQTLISSVQMMARAYGINVLGIMGKPATPAKLLKLIRHHNMRQPYPGFGRVTATECSTAKLRHALHDGQFIPYCQPQVDITTGHIAGVDVHARWHHPSLGLLDPMQFTDALHSAGLHEPLTRLMLEQVAAAQIGWTDNGLEITASLALPATMLEDPQLADNITAWITPAGTAVESMAFEVTGLASASNTTTVRENLARLRMKKFGITVEYNGAANGSMYALTQYPFTHLKIGHAIMADPVCRERLREFIEAPLATAARFDFKTIAYQVENIDDWNQSARFGCNFAQGHFVAPAMDIEKIFAWAQHRRARV